MARSPPSRGAQGGSWTRSCRVCRSRSSPLLSGRCRPPPMSASASRDYRETSSGTRRAQLSWRERVAHATMNWQFAIARCQLSLAGPWVLLLFSVLARRCALRFSQKGLRCSLANLHSLCSWGSTCILGVSTSQRPERVCSGSERVAPTLNSPSLLRVATPEWLMANRDCSSISAAVSLNVEKTSLHACDEKPAMNHRCVRSMLLVARADDKKTYR